jgi:UDP-glucose 4-epimerase
MNVGSDCEMTVLKLAEEIISITGSKSRVVHLPALKEGDMTRRNPDISKMKKILNRDLLSLNQGILEMCKG